MLKQILHVGITVSNLEKSRKFYSNILGLKDLGDLRMQGKETNLLFNKADTDANVAYLSGKENSALVELIEFKNPKIENKKMDIFRTGISELCFYTDDIEKFYKKLIDNNVETFSAPQNFDFTSYGFGKSKAIYFRDPDGTILEVIEII